MTPESEEWSSQGTRNWSWRQLPKRSLPKASAHPHPMFPTPHPGHQGQLPRGCFEGNHFHLDIKVLVSLLKAKPNYLPDILALCTSRAHWRARGRVHMQSNGLLELPRSGHCAPTLSRPGIALSGKWDSRARHQLSGPTYL